jgi:hypothetical protein
MSFATFRVLSPIEPVAPSNTTRLRFILFSHYGHKVPQSHTKNRFDNRYERCAPLRPLCEITIAPG